HFNEEASKAIVQDIRFVPYGNCYYIEVVYDDGQASSNNVLLNKSNIMGIDLGINNLATIVFNQPGICPVLINGKPIKSINHRFNKYKKELQEAREAKHINCIVVKRRNRINDYFHKASKRIIDLCLKTDTGTIVIGYNKGWKESSNIGKVNNQNFTNIPHLDLVNKIKYKAKKYGIDVIVTEESYTSKASSLDLDDIPTYGLVNNKKPVFSGTRVKRGLYKAKNGVLLNADVNGSINIIRKVFENASVKKLFGSGCVFQPIRVTC
uniref:RNA-guided endonuclease InsQ/TnpB family protein n=1 Tax=uncultured Anaerobiospirillum sp. TaxID=265728 RepID=UPI002805D872